MSTIKVTFISLFCAYVTIFKKKCVLNYDNIMFGLNFDKLKTNFAFKTVYRVKNQLK